MKRMLLFFGLLAVITFIGLQSVDAVSGLTSDTVETTNPLLIDVDYPATMRVGEAVQLYVKDTPGFVAVSGQFQWALLGSSSGKGEFAKATAITSSPEPVFTATAAGDVRVKLLMIVDAAMSSQSGLKTGQLVEREFTITVQK